MDRCFTCLARGKSVVPGLYYVATVEVAGSSIRAGLSPARLGSRDTRKISRGVPLGGFVFIR
jgi:hypothetical protein